MKKGDSKKRLLKSLMDISGFVNFVETPELILDLIIEESVLLTRAEYGAILTYDKNLNLETFHITRVTEDKEKARISNRLNVLVKESMHEDSVKTILQEEFWSSPDIKNKIKKDLGKGVKSFLISPISKKGQFMGLSLVVNKKGEKEFTKEDQENFSFFCSEASIVIENINIFRDKLQAERLAAIGQTIAGISHYIKNVLQGISTGSYLLNVGIKKSDIATISNAWRVVDKNTKRISDLVMDMLFYSKERKFTKEKVDPKLLVEDVLQLIKPKLKEKNVKLKFSIEKLPSFIVANEKGIHRSILNLLGNAADACNKPDSAIELKASFDQPTQSLKITISDNGKGMSKEDSEKIFQPFFSSKGTKGTGLGLAITKKVVDEHKGSIRIESKLNQGTTFEISIPK